MTDPLVADRGSVKSIGKRSSAARCQTETHSGTVMLVVGRKKVEWGTQLAFLQQHVANKHGLILGEPCHTVNLY